MAAGVNIYASKRYLLFCLINNILYILEILGESKPPFKSIFMANKCFLLNMNINYVTQNYVIT